MKRAFSVKGRQFISSGRYGLGAKSASIKEIVTRCSIPIPVLSDLGRFEITVGARTSTSESILHRDVAKPLKIFVSFSLAIFLTGFGYGLFKVLLPGWRYGPTLAMLISISVVLFLVGLIYEKTPNSGSTVVGAVTFMAPKRRQCANVLTRKGKPDEELPILSELPGEGAS